MARSARSVDRSGLGPSAPARIDLARRTSRSAPVYPAVPIASIFKSTSGASVRFEAACLKMAARSSHSVGGGTSSDDDLGEDRRGVDQVFGRFVAATTHTFFESLAFRPSRRALRGGRGPTRVSALAADRSGRTGADETRSSSSKITEGADAAARSARAHSLLRLAHVLAVQLRAGDGDEVAAGRRRHRARQHRLRAPPGGRTGAFPRAGTAPTRRSASPCRSCHSTASRSCCAIAACPPTSSHATRGASTATSRSALGLTRRRAARKSANVTRSASSPTMYRCSVAPPFARVSVRLDHLVAGDARSSL